MKFCDEFISITQHTTTESDKPLRENDTETGEILKIL